MEKAREDEDRDNDRKVAVLVARFVRQRSRQQTEQTRQALLSLVGYRFSRLHLSDMPVLPHLLKPPYMLPDVLETLTARYRRELLALVDKLPVPAAVAADKEAQLLSEPLDVLASRVDLLAIREELAELAPLPPALRRVLWPQLVPPLPDMAPVGHRQPLDAVIKRLAQQTGAPLAVLTDVYALSGRYGAREARLVRRLVQELDTTDGVAELCVRLLSVLDKKHPQADPPDLDRFLLALMMT